MEQLVTVLQNLHEALSALGDAAIRLPAIVAIGGQSSGKSSVLENIVGRYGLLDLNWLNLPENPISYCIIFYQGFSSSWYWDCYSSPSDDVSTQCSAPISFGFG